MNAAPKLAFGAIAVAVLLVAIVVRSRVLTLQRAPGARERQWPPRRFSGDRGGQPAGKVDLEIAEDRKSVEATITFDDPRRRVGRDARVVIASQNLLGQKRLELTSGTTTDPAPDGYVVPGDRVQAATDLDQVLDVLDASTRARLTVLINEAGRAVSGREEDLSTLLQQLPPTFADIDELLDELVADNRVLATTVRRADRVLASFTPQRKALADALGSVAGLATTVNARRPELRSTLAKAPGTLRTVRAFLGDLEQTTAPLGQAARDVATVAPELESTLDEVRPFTTAAEPALDEAQRIAPQLTALGVRATPVLRRLTPTLDALDQFATSLAPVSQMLRKSTANLFGIVDNWTHAIQGRDNLSHVFRGNANYSTAGITAFLDRLAQAAAPQAAQAQDGRDHSTVAPRPRYAGSTCPAARSPFRRSRCRRRAQEALDGIGRSCADSTAARPLLRRQRPPPIAVKPGRSSSRGRSADEAHHLHASATPRRAPRAGASSCASGESRCSAQSVVWTAVTSYSGVPLRDYDHYVVEVPATGNLIAHDQVRIGGVRVGQVEKTAITPDGKARLALQLERGTRLPADTQVVLRANGLLGARYVQLVPGASSRLLRSGKRAQGRARFAHLRRAGDVGGARPSDPRRAREDDRRCRPGAARQRRRPERRHPRRRNAGRPAARGHPQRARNRPARW